MQRQRVVWGLWCPHGGREGVARWLPAGGCELLRGLLSHTQSESGNHRMCPGTCTTAKLCKSKKNEPQEDHNREEQLLPLSTSLERPLLTKV